MKQVVLLAALAAAILAGADAVSPAAAAPAPSLFQSDALPYPFRDGYPFVRFPNAPVRK